jgi:hypothetical protein
MATTPKKLAIFALSNKGGVGKTTLAKAFTDYVRRERVQAAVYDTDGDVKGLLKLYGKTDDGGATFNCNPLTDVGYFNMQIDADRENVVNAIESKADVLFFDTPAGSIRKIFTSLNNAHHFVDTLNMEGYELVLMLLVDPYDDTIDGIQSAVDLFGDKAKYVVWKNMNNAKKDDFVYFEPISALPDAEPMFQDDEGKSISARELVESYGGQVFEMPYLPLRTNARIRRLHLQFGEAAAPGSPLKVNDRALVRSWLDELNEQFARMFANFKAGQ